MDTRGMLKVVARANSLHLMGAGFLNAVGVKAALDAYNGIGPEFFPPAVRDAITRTLGLFEPPAVIHDCRFERSDGSRAAFDYANCEFFVNCHLCAKAAYRWWDWRRYRAYAVIDAMYGCVSGDGGWKAWQEAHGKRRTTRGARQPRIADDFPSHGASEETNKERTGKMKKLIALGALAVVAAVAGCKSIEVNRRARQVAMDGSGQVIKDAAGTPIVLDMGWEVDYFQHWNWQKFDSLHAKAGEAEVELNGYEGGAAASNLVQLVSVSMDGAARITEKVVAAIISGGGSVAAEGGSAAIVALANKFIAAGGDAAIKATTAAVSNLAESLADGNVTQEELGANVCSIESAIKAWKKAV